MERWPDGSVYLVAGELIPYICPKCTWAIEFDASLSSVTCSNCGHTGPTEEFTEKTWELRKPN